MLGSKWSASSNSKNELNIKNKKNPNIFFRLSLRTRPFRFLRISRIRVYISVDVRVIFSEFKQKRYNFSLDETSFRK